MTRYITFLLALALASPIATAEAVVIRVPGDAGTIQEAVGTAYPGDTIEVGAGRWCGAFIDERVNLVGRDGAVIVGRIDDTTMCTGAAIGGLKIGFSLDSGAKGTTISHFTFDGETAADDPNVLSLAVYGQGASDVTLEHNTVLGTLFAFVNKGGDGWTIRKNHVRGLTVRGVGGAAIVVSQAPNTPAGPRNTVIAHNHVEGDVPDAVGPAVGFPDPAGHFAAVRLAGVEGVELSHNQYRLRSKKSNGSVKGVGVFVTEGPASSGGGGGGGTRNKLGATSSAASQPGLPSVGVDLRHENGKNADFLAVVHAGCDVTVRQSQGAVLD